MVIFLLAKGVIELHMTDDDMSVFRGEGWVAKWAEDFYTFRPDFHKENKKS